ncbi:PQQ-binding-like beta-propeller repeat protein [Planctomycetota bacterium]
MRAMCMLIGWLCLTATAGAASSDWPQYLGPSRNGVAPEAKLARTWPEGGPRVLWSIEVDEGYGGAIIQDGKAYFMDRIDSSEDRLRCVDLNSGKELWHFGYDAPGRLSYPGSRSHPLINGDLIFTCGAHGDFYCVNITTGKPVWNRNVWTDYGGEREPRWGITQNPLIYGQTVIVASQAPKAGLIAFDQETGKEVWVSPKLPGRPGYVSPILTRIEGQDQLVMVTAGQPGGRGGRPPRERGGVGGRAGEPPRNDEGARPPRPQGPDRMMDRQRPQERRPMEGSGSGEKGAVIGIDPTTGKELWTYEGWQCQTPVPPATAIGDGRIFVTGGYGAGSAMIRIVRSGSGFEAKEIYKTQDFGTHVHPPIVHDGHLYAHCSDNHGRSDGMVCMNLDGNVQWKTGRDPAFNKGGFIFVGDLSLHIDGSKGILYLMEPNPEAFKSLTQAQVLDGRSWAPLSLSDGKLIVRDQETMKCLMVK